MAETIPNETQQQGRPERRRRSRRFPITAGARFSWQGSDGVWHQGKGKTRDVSILGVFIWAYPILLPGTPVEITVDIPPLLQGGAALRLIGWGSVLRIDFPDTQAIGFAAEVNFQTGRIGVACKPDTET